MPGSTLLLVYSTGRDGQLLLLLPLLLLLVGTSDDGGYNGRPIKKRDEETQRETEGIMRDCCLFVVVAVTLLHYCGSLVFRRSTADVTVSLTRDKLQHPERETGRETGRERRHTANTDTAVCLSIDKHTLSL